MSVYIRRFSFDPGNEVLLDIESVNILDLDPPATIAGVGTGTALIVGEFEDGPFAAGGNAPGQASDPVYEVSGATDLVNTFGALGYTYDGIVGNHPAARARKADSAIAKEFWNGNGFVQLSGKRFRRLLVARVDTSVGQVQFRRQAYLTGGSGFYFDLEPGETLIVSDAGTTRTATFDAAAATLNSGSQTWPSGFTGGEQLVVGVDGQPNVTVTFQAGDQSQAQMITRINLAMGFTFAASVSGTVMSFTGITRGKSGQVRIVSGTTGVLAKFAVSAGTTFGTGDVGDIDAVNFSELKTVIEADMTAGGIKLEKDSSGNLRLSKTYSTDHDWLTLSASSTAKNLGFVDGQHASNSGYAYLRSGAQTFPNGFSGGETLTLQYDDQPNVTVTFQAGDTTQVAVINRINGILGYTAARAISGTVTELRSKANGGTIAVVSSSGATNLAFTNGSVTGTAITTGKLPAGTVVQDSAGAQKFVTMQAVTITLPQTGVTASGVGPYSVKVRHATDDGTGTSATAGTLIALERAPEIGSFAVTNSDNVSAALSEGAIDAAYADAFDSTLDVNSVACEANMAWSARQSNACRTKARANAIEASDNGCFGRITAVRPPLGTSKSTAQGSAPGGVGATRSQRVVYCYPGANTTVPAIAKRGLAGGEGFTATGQVDVGSDGFLVSCASQLPPEENPGQETPFLSMVNSVETSMAVQGLQMSDYKAFRAKGICGIRVAGGSAFFQSGVTSVDPAVQPQLRNIARRRMADFIQDTISARAQAYGKKLSTLKRRKAFATEIRVFMEQLLSRQNDATQRIAGYTVDSISGNTPSSLAAGIYRVIIRVRTLASLDSIVLQTEIGESVEVEEQLAEAA